MKQNLPILTGLRFFAAFYVFIFHIYNRYSFDSLGKTISDFIAQGAVGVNIFFILSGFILYYNYHDREVNFTEFILKRLAKIYPVYLAGFILCLLVVLLMHIKIEYFFEIMMMNLLLVQSYLPKFSMQWYGSGSWSISTEFFFYLCFPLLLKLISSLSKKNVAVFFALSYIFSFLPGVLYDQSIIRSELTYTFPPSRIWEFIVGMLTAALVIRYKVTINNLLISIIVISSTVFFYFIGKNLEGHVIQNTIAVPLMAIILCTVTTRKKHILLFLGNPFFEYLGKISYSFYIIQIPMLRFLVSIENFMIYNTFVTVLILFFINLIGAIVLYHIIESPLHQFLNKKIKQWFGRIKTASL